MRTVSVTLFVVVVALGLSACLGDDFYEYDEGYNYGTPQYSSGYAVGGYPQYGGMTYGKGYGHGYGKGYGHGYGKGHGKGYGRVESTVIRAPYPAPMYVPPPMPIGGYGDDGGLFGENNGLILMLLLLPFLLSNSNGGLLG